MLGITLLLLMQAGARSLVPAQLPLKEKLCYFPSYATGTQERSRLL